MAYWMQASCRVHYNHALEYAIREADKQGKPLIVYFGLTSDFPEANLRHYNFLVEGLREVERSLEEMNVKMVILNRSPELGALEIAENASLMVTDRGYLDIGSRWRDLVADKIKCRMVQVESDVVVPVETASPKEEYAAATIRRKINSNLKRYLIPLDSHKPVKSSLEMGFSTINLDKIINQLDIDRSVKQAPYLHGGTSEAFKWLETFNDDKLDRFPDIRNDPSRQCQSNMSPYLHFGQISPLYIALKVSQTNSPGRDSYLEELIIRRELSVNFVYYNSEYKNMDCLPNWASKTLLEHESDQRPYNYSLKELEEADTHDPYWNAAQKEMVYTGKMHGYMRMYWGKKILEWVETPREAYQIALYLNNKYELDGRDPNSYAGVAWCFGKHDRAWKERKIFGKIRYMNDQGLRRKFKIDKYIERIDGLVELID